MKYLLDTDVVISYLKGQEDIINLLQKHQSQLALSVISLGEILEGIYGESQEKSRLKSLNDFLTGVTLLVVDQKIIKLFAQIRSKLRKKGKLVDNFDILIAATAQGHHLALITGNKKHFFVIKAAAKSLKILD